jgi:hypothetical protein
MGRYCQSGQSHFVIPNQFYKAAYKALDFVEDDEKTDEQNLIDCLADFEFKCIKKSKESLTFILDDKNSDHDFDWHIMMTLTPYFNEDSFYEQIHFDEGMLVGVVKLKKDKKYLSRDFYHLAFDSNEKYIRGEFMKKFDVNLELD